MAPASLTDFHWLFSVPSSKCCISTSDRLWPLPSTSIPVHYAPASPLILCTMYCDIGRLVSEKFWLQAVNHSSGDWSVCHVQMKKCICCWMMKLCCRDFTPSTLTQNYSGTVHSPLWQRQIKTWWNWTCCLNMWQQTMRLPTYCQNGSDISFVGQEPAQNGQAGCKALEE